jgi:hypothetical protein
LLFVSAAVQFAMMEPTQRYGKFVAHFASERPLLDKSKMMRIGRAAAADEARLRRDEFEVIPIAEANGFADRDSPRRSRFASWRAR